MRITGDILGTDNACNNLRYFEVHSCRKLNKDCAHGEKYCEARDKKGLPKIGISSSLACAQLSSPKREISPTFAFVILQ